MTFDYSGKRVVITGGVGFLGQAVVRALLDAGATCEVTWHSDAEQRHLPAAHDRLRLHQVDASDESAVTKLYAGLGDLWASVHVVGAFTMAPLAETSLGDFRKMFDVN